MEIKKAAIKQENAKALVDLVKTYCPIKLQKLKVIFHFSSNFKDIESQNILVFNESFILNVYIDSWG